MNGFIPKLIEGGEKFLTILFLSSIENPLDKISHQILAKKSCLGELRFDQGTVVHQIFASRISAVSALVSGMSGVTFVCSLFEFHLPVNRQFQKET